MSHWGQHAPSTPGGASSGGTTGTVKAAVGLTMLAIALAVIEAIVAVYMLQQMDAPGAGLDAEEIEVFKVIFGFMIGINLIISAGLTGGAILALRRSVGGKVLIWLAGSASTLMRLSCGGLAGFGTYMTNLTDETNDSPLSAAMWVALLIIELLGLIAILVAMIMLMTKGASFKDPALVPPGAGYGPPPGYGPPGGQPPGYGPPGGQPPGGPNDGLPNLPPSSGWPT